MAQRETRLVTMAKSQPLPGDHDDYANGSEGHHVNTETLFFNKLDGPPSSNFPPRLAETR